MHGRASAAGAMPAMQRPAQLAGSAATVCRCGPAGPVGRASLDWVALQHLPVLLARLPVGELRESVASAANDGAIVEVDNLVKRYRKGKTNAVDGISFTVRKGEFPILDVAVMAGMFVVFLVVGTALFVRNERNR